MQVLSVLYGRLLEVLALAACGVLLLMMLMICGDVILRNVDLWPSWRGLPWADDASEYMLCLMTVLAAPWLLRQGRHIRIDILLRAIPPRIGWYCEWAADALAFICCTAMIVAGGEAAYASFAAGALIIKSFVIPEWWLLTPLPAAFAFLAVEVLFRMHRLAGGARAPRDDAVSAS